MVCPLGQLTEDGPNPRNESIHRPQSTEPKPSNVWQWGLPAPWLGAGGIPSGRLEGIQPCRSNFSPTIGIDRYSAISPRTWQNCRPSRRFGRDIAFAIGDAKPGAREAMVEGATSSKDGFIKRKGCKQDPFTMHNPLLEMRIIAKTALKS